MKHTCHHISDVAQGLATLGSAADNALGKIWMLPCQPAETTRVFAKRFEPYLEQEIQMKAMPRWLLKSLGLFVPIMRELGEMACQWDEPFVVDDGNFCAHFDVRPVAIEKASQAMTEWAKATYST